MPEKFASAASKLVDASCEAYTGSSGWKNKIFSSGSTHSSFKLWISQVLAIDTVISLAFELGTFSYESWTHIFRYCYKIRFNNHPFKLSDDLIKFCLLLLGVPLS